MERVHSTEFRIVIDTNKRTIDERFYSPSELIDRLWALADEGLVGMPEQWDPSQTDPAVDVLRVLNQIRPAADEP